MTNLNRTTKIFSVVFLLVSVLARPMAAAAAGDIQNLATVHWLGLKQISADTNSAAFLKVWNLPQTRTLLAQTLEKISRLPGHGATNAASALVRPLLDDLIASEFYVEVAASTNDPSSILHPPSSASNINSVSAPKGEGRGEVTGFLALRIPGDRAQLWQTNLAAALGVLSGNRPVVNGKGWAFGETSHSGRIEFARAGDWCLISIGCATPVAASSFARRVALLPRPAANSPWLEAGLYPPVLSAFGPTFFLILGDLPAVSHFQISLTGRTNGVHTLASFDLSHPLAGALPAWNIPTNLIHGPLTSFTAARGFAGWLAASPVWQKLKLAPAPDQAFCWSQAGIPLQTYLAAPLPAASNQLFQLAPKFVADVNPWLATNAQGNVAWSDNPPGLIWHGANLMTPFLISGEFYQPGFVIAGIYPPTVGAAAFPPLRVQQAMLRNSELLACQLEGTGSRIEDGLFVSQLMRLVFHKPQMPASAPGTLWLKSAETNVFESFTTVNRTTPSRIILERDSTVGFTAVELHLFADWLESPQFPSGLHTLLAPPDKPVF